MNLNWLITKIQSYLVILFKFVSTENQMKIRNKKYANSFGIKFSIFVI